MDAKRCDKCKTFFDPSDEYTIIRYGKMGGFFSTTVDLCEKCSKEFIDFLIPDKKEN